MTPFKPVIVGGQDISSLRAHFDDDDRNLIVASNRQLTYFSIESCQQNGHAYIPSSKLTETERIVACDKLESNLYLFTNYGRSFCWSLTAKDWTNEQILPIDPENETLISCKMPSKRQYIFSTRDTQTNDVKLYYTMSRSERERPKQWEVLGECTGGYETSFDIGCAVPQHEMDQANKTTQDKLSKQRVVTFINGSQIYFQKIGIGEKLHINLSKQIIAEHKFTCVRANSKRPMIAAGDSLGRIYIYSGDFNSKKPWSNRTKLHWHSQPVNDLCFSSTGQTLYSAGGESGCIVIWDLSGNSMGQYRVIPSLGMPMRHINCSINLQQLVLSSEDNEIIFMDTDMGTHSIKTLTRRTYDMYLHNDYKALRFEGMNSASDLIGKSRSVGLLWHPKTDSLVTNTKTGCLQFYSPKKQAKIDLLDCLKSRILSLELDGKVIPSEITCAAFSFDGDWLALYETRESGDMFPEVKLHIWQRSSTNGRWFWIQTADRLHSSVAIADLKFSPDGQFLVSVGEDGIFHVLHRLCLDEKSASKQMYAKGFFGNIPEKMASRAAFSQDSSVLAISLKDETTLIWMIVDPYKLEYECQLNRVDSGGDIDMLALNNPTETNRILHNVLGLHFGQHEPSRGIAPLCEVRSNYIRIWNILNAQSNTDEMMEYLADESSSNGSPTEGVDVTSDCEEFTAATFDQSFSSNHNTDHFVVVTKKQLIYIFELKINQTSRRLQPLIVIDGSLAQANLHNVRHYTHICFLAEPILEIDKQCHQNVHLLRLVNRLCLMTNEQELVSFTDKLTIERQSATNNCNAIKSYELTDLQAYLSKGATSYNEEISNLSVSDKTMDTKAITEKQRRIRRRLEVQRMLKDIFERIPSHNLPRIEILAPMILDKLSIN